MLGFTESPAARHGSFFQQKPSVSFAAKYSALLARFYRQVWLGLIESDQPIIPPGSLILAGHYNGAIDGMTYGSQLPAFLVVVSVQWQRNFVGRWLVPGIAVQRGKDRPVASGNVNEAAFRAMIAAISGGDCLLFFPEGTSRLGVERLPVRRGTRVLLRELRAAKDNARVFFVAAHYHQPTLWRSAASLGWIGPVPLPVDDVDDEVWVGEHIRQAQAAAYALPEPPARRCTGVGALAALPFLPVWAVTSRLAQQIADDTNVIALWKFLLGVPATILALGAYTCAVVACGLPWWLPLASLVCGWFLWAR